MFNGFYPFVKIIVVPEDVSSDCAGEYASDRAGKILTDFDKGQCDRQSISLRALSERVFALSFQLMSPYVWREEKTARAKGVELPKLLAQRDAVLSPDAEVATWNQERPIQTRRAKGTTK